MCEHFLSSLHIQKLSHPLEEIRIRALSSVISKYNLNLVDETNIENIKILLEKLFGWFTFDKCPEEKKVFSLMHRIIKSDDAKVIIMEMGLNNFLEKLNDLNKKTEYRHSNLLNEIKSYFETNKEVCTNLNGHHSSSQKLILENLNDDCDNNVSNNQLEYNGNIHFKTNFQISKENPSLVLNHGEKPFAFQTSLNTLNISEKKNLCNNNFKIEFFPWQNLVANDKQVLSSVFDGLKYVDDKYSVLKTCHFFNEIILRDFPPEIFIQRPLIFRTFLQLIETVGSDLKIPVTKCLIKMVQCLKCKIKLSLNAALFSKKKEFYTTSVYPDESFNDSNDIDQRKLPEKFHKNFPTSFDENVCSNEESVNDMCKLKKFQLALSEFCFETLTVALSQLKKNCSQEEANNFLELCFESLTCIIMNLKSDVWQAVSGLVDKFYKVLGLIQELMQFYKHQNTIFFIIFLNFVVKILKLLKMPSDLNLNNILPKALQLELENCIFYSSLHIMFPQLHSDILNYVKRLNDRQEGEFYQDYKDVSLILNSMKNCCSFLKASNTFKNKTEILQCIDEALPSLHFNENHEFVRLFVKICLLKWCKSQLDDSQLKMREQITLKLLSHGNANVKSYIYSEISDNVVKLLGEKEAALARYEFPGDKLEFLFHTDVLTEIICHGLSSDLNKVCESSNIILTHFLRSKFLMSEPCWNDFMAALIPCLGLLECFADKSTLLGRCIIKIFDPDVARSTGLPPIELIKGNIRLMFSKNTLLREEAISRLFWLLNQEDNENKKLPKMSVLTSLNLSAICVSVKREDYSSLQQSFYNPGKVCDILEMLASESLEPNIRRSALSQLSVMMEDVLLHSTFLEQKGLQLMLSILNNSLIEGEYRYYPDSVMPIIDILKQVSLHNAGVCQDLGSRISVLYNVLRSLFLFSSDDRLRRNAVELLCLILYGDCILRVPSEKSTSRFLSFPGIVVKEMILPFEARTHWKNSKYFEMSLKKTLLGKKHILKLIRIYWAVQWSGSLSVFLATNLSDFKEKTFSPGIPEDMKISYSDIEELKKCSFNVSVKQLLCDIQNASTHEAVYSSIHKIETYLLMYSVSKVTYGNYENGVTNENILSHMLWESTLERFMASFPTCLKDESLLLLLVEFIQKLLKIFKSDRLINWIAKIIVDVNKPLYKVLKYLEKNYSGLKGKELRLSIIQLIQLVIMSGTPLESNKWFSYVELISDFLKLERKENEFHNVAYFDWFIGLLMFLTKKCSFADNPDHQKCLIIRIMEIIIAFHCTSDSAVSFMGLNIVKNSLFALNHILVDMQNNVQGWEKVWFQALSTVIGHVENVNYCWLLSLWFMRDPIVRSVSFQLFVGFSKTVKSCELLLNRLNISYQLIWSEGFKIFFNEEECCCVREKCGLLLANLIYNNEKLLLGNITECLNSNHFYQKIFEMVENFQPKHRYSELILDNTSNVFKDEIFTTPALITSLSVLMQNFASVDSANMCKKIVESGIIDVLARTLGEIPDSVFICEKHHESVDILNCYISVCRLMTTCVLCDSTSRTFLLHSYNTIYHLFSMINYNLYCSTSKTISRLRTDLWLEILNLLSALLLVKPKQGTEADDHAAFLAINRCMSENGVDPFISSLYIALTSDSLPLKLSTQQFLINLFQHEIAMQRNVSMADIFERKISEEALQLSKCRGSREFQIQENQTLNFGIRLADILMQIFLLNFIEQSGSSKLLSSNALGELFAVCQSGQDFCLKQNLGSFIIKQLKKICINLSLENASTLKKLPDKKRLNPQLQDIELLCQLLNNFLYDNEPVKKDLANNGLCAVIHKFWPWCVIKPSLHEVILKMLCTFTHSFPQGCRSMVLTSNVAVITLKKMPGSMTLLNALINQITVEMDFITKTKDCLILRLCLQILSNCCSVTECRSVISKGNIFFSFLKIQNNWKKRFYNEEVIDSWLKFFVIFSSHQEGQLAFIKNQDILNILYDLASTAPKSDQKTRALLVLRNICFHQLNKYKMLNWCEFLILLQDFLTSSKSSDVQHAANAIWSLSCNSQKDKLILRSAGFEEKLEIAKRQAIVGNDSETEELLTIIIGILKNK